MPIHTALWTVNAQPKQLVQSRLDSEKLLEDMILASPRILSDEWMLIGQQEDTGYGGRIDLLAIAPDGSLVLIELKRDRTPREVVAQALDYASWVMGLTAEQINAIYQRFKPGKDLAEDFRARFGATLGEDMLNQSHQIVIVAASLDASTERIVSYLNGRQIPINVLCFQVFGHNSEQFLSRAWLLDPIQTQSNASTEASQQQEPWNGEFYCSFGDSVARSWEDAVQFGFICGGGGSWYSKTLQLLNPGDRVWVNIPGSGYVGVGYVTGRALPASDFNVPTPEGEKPALEVAKRGSYHVEYLDDPEKCEYFVPMKWLQTVPAGQAVREIGFFGNQNTICKPVAAKWRATVDRLKVRFPGFDC
jgi:hypothetical protein